MLCEKCNEREATTHIAKVGRNGELSKHNFCERCYGVFTLTQESQGKMDVAGWTSYSPIETKRKKL
jgi:protein-arginine kinase activator protein McsA